MASCVYKVACEYVYIYIYILLAVEAEYYANIYNRLINVDYKK